jgi:transposase
LWFRDLVKGGPMSPITLTVRQRVDLQIAVAHAPSAREWRRAQALLWLSEGESVEAVAELLGVSRQTVYNWVDRFRERSALDSPARLTDAPRPGRPRAGGGDIDLLISGVIDSDPRTLGYRPTVWTAPLLGRYLRDHHEIIVSDRTVSRSIARLGLRWKRPRHELARRPDTWRQSKGGSNAGWRAAPAPCC